MANEEHLKILKQDMAIWNQWRENHPEIRPSLRGADLHAADLRFADLSDADLVEANLHWADLVEANLKRANLSNANLNGANLSNADLRGTNFFGAILFGADIIEAKLAKADLSEAGIGLTHFNDVDLSEVRGLLTVHHGAPSSIGIDTIYRSQGNIPEIFLRGCGVSDDFIALIKALAGSIQFYSCFISYASKDQEFADRLHADLQSTGVRCWFAKENLKTGDKLRPSFDDAIRIHDKLMVVLSEHSIKSPWVEKEVETAFEKERQQNRIVLFPIRLDDAVMKTQQAWAADIRRTRHIGDFRDWKNHNSYKEEFDRLLRDLRAEGSSSSAATNRK